MKTLTFLALISLAGSAFSAYYFSSSQGKQSLQRMVGFASTDAPSRPAREGKNAGQNTPMTERENRPRRSEEER